MENFVRLSESKLRQELLDFYESEGITAWSTDRVPFFATNNPALAKSYGDLALAFFEDCRSKGLIDENEPVYLVELGGGMGRLAYLILNRLEQLSQASGLKLRYLLTDYSQSNVDYYKKHEKLQPALESGLLQVQTFDAENDSTLEVAIKNPIFCFANYLFDSLSQDGFRVRDGSLSEVSCSRTKDDKFIPCYRDADSKPYGIPDYDETLKLYRENLGNTHFGFPIGPLRCLENLSTISQGAMALVMADKAFRTLEDQLNFESLPFERHEKGFSMTVNCHAIDQIWLKRGGTVFHSAERTNPLKIALYSRLPEAGKLPKTQGVFTDQIDDFGPLDYLDFRGQMIARTKNANFNFFLQMLRLSRWDAEFLYELNNEIAQATVGAPLNQQKELYDALVKCWSNFFPIPDERNVPFAVARILACINQFDQAIHFYSESERLYGAQAAIKHNIGICYCNLGQFEQAKNIFLDALELDPNYSPSRELLIQTESELKRRSELKP